MVWASPRSSSTPSSPATGSRPTRRICCGWPPTSAVLDELQDRDLLRHSEDLGAELCSAVRDLTGDDDGVAQVRGAGLFLGVEMVTPDGAPDPGRAARVVNAMRERRILISASGTSDNVLKIRPPLVFPRSAAPRLLDGLAASLAASRTAAAGR